MAKFRKVVVAANRTYQSSLGPVPVSTNRIQGWIDKFRAQKKKGIKIPVPWGHQPKANPINAGNKEEEEFLKSRYNATYLEDLELSPQGEMVMVAEIPPGMELDDKGNVVDPKTHTAIGEVSLSSRDWKDGDGVEWKDTIRHIAFTPLPVAHGTPGFEPALLATLEAGEVRLSLSMATFPTEDEGKDKEGKDKKADDKKEGDEKKPEEEEEEKPTGEGDFTVERASELLKEFDIVVSEAKDPEEFVRHLCIALDALCGQLRDEEETYQEEPIPAMMSLAGKTTFALASRLRRLKRITERRKEKEAKIMSEKKPETPPAVLSLSDHTDPIVRALGAKLAQDESTKRMNRIAALEQRGLPPTVAKALREEAGTVQLSLSDGKLVEPLIDQKLTVLEQSMPDKDPLTATLSLREVPPPEENTSDKEMLEEAKKRGEALSSPARGRQRKTA